METIIERHVRLAENTGHECSKEEENDDKDQELDVVPLLGDDGGLHDGSTAFEDGGTAEEVIPKAFDFLHLTLIHLHDFLQLTQLILNILPQIPQAFPPVGIPRRGVLISRPDNSIRTVPDQFFGGVFIGANHFLDIFGHDTQRLVRPEIASRIGKLVIFEQQAVPHGLLRHEVWL